MGEWPWRDCHELLRELWGCLYFVPSLPLSLLSFDICIALFLTVGSRWIRGVGSFGNSSSASGSGNPRVTIVPLYSYDVRIPFFYSHCTSFNFNYFRLSFFLCLFVLFQSFCSHMQVFGRTLGMSSTFSIAILNETFYFFALQKQQLVLVWSAV